MKAILAKKLIFNYCMLQSIQQRNSYYIHAGGYKMKTGIVTALFLMIVLTGSIAFAKDCKDTICY